MTSLKNLFLPLPLFSLLSTNTLSMFLLRQVIKNWIKFVCGLTFSLDRSKILSTFSWSSLIFSTVVSSSPERQRASSCGKNPVLLPAIYKSGDNNKNFNQSYNRCTTYTFIDIFLNSIMISSINAIQIQ